MRRVCWVCDKPIELGDQTVWSRRHAMHAACSIPSRVERLRVRREAQAAKQERE